MRLWKCSSSGVPPALKLRALVLTEADAVALRAIAPDVEVVVGDLRRRATLWELTTAMSVLYAGADILIMYNPEAVAALKRAITRLMDTTSPSTLDPRPSTL